MPFTYYIAAVVILWMLVLVASYYWDQSMDMAAKDYKTDRQLDAEKDTL